MRTIDLGREPAEFTEWKQVTPGVGYADISSELRQAIKVSLIQSQRGLCAYTGIRINLDSSHVEHLIPQNHCRHGEALQYTNMVACFPGSTEGSPFGARKKDNWPDQSQKYLFVSPRSQDCESRFDFDLQGKITATSQTDHAADETILKLGLDHRQLVGFRKEAINGTLLKKTQGNFGLNRQQARTCLNQLRQKEEAGGELDPFCFVLKQALEKHIRRLEAIANTGRER